MCMVDRFIDCEREKMRWLGIVCAVVCWIGGGGGGVLAYVSFSLQVDVSVVGSDALNLV